jgi:hypothetical protein
VAEVPDELRALRAWLDGSLATATLAAAASALATTPRTLQRRLGEAATSFQRELTERVEPGVSGGQDARDSGDEIR